jgi:hypothetical protein
MGVIKSGHNSSAFPNNFGASDAVTATALNNHVNDSKFDTTAVDDSTIELTTSDTKLQVKDDGITFAKMQNISTDKILGRTTAGSGSVEELSFLDENDLSSDSDTAIATQQSIKAYVDAITQSHALFVYDDSSVTTLNTDDTTFSQCPLTQSYNFITGVSVSSNNITLPIGTYIVDGIANIAITNNNKNNGAINILEKTDGTDLLRGMDVSTDNDFSTNSTRLTRVMGKLNITESTDIRWMFRRQAAGTRAVTLGRNLGQGSAPNAYLKITKIGL